MKPRPSDIDALRDAMLAASRKWLQERGYPLVQWDDMRAAACGVIIAGWVVTTGFPQEDIVDIISKVAAEMKDELRRTAS